MYTINSHLCLSIVSLQTFSLEASLLFKFKRDYSKENIKSIQGGLLSKRSLNINFHSVRIE